LLRKRVARQVINHSMSFQYVLIKKKNFLIQAHFYRFYFIRAEFLSFILKHT